MTSQSKLDNVSKKRIDLMLRKNVYCWIFVKRRRPIFVYRTFKNVFYIFDNNKYKTYLLAFDKFMWTRCVSDKN